VGKRRVRRMRRRGDKGDGWKGVRHWQKHSMFGAVGGKGWACTIDGESFTALKSCHVGRSTYL
jgi:hypothetical protein